MDENCAAQWWTRIRKKVSYRCFFLNFFINYLWKYLKNHSCLVCRHIITHCTIFQFSAQFLLVALVFWVMHSCSPASVLILYANNYNKKNGPSFVFSFLPLNIQHKSNQNAYYYFLLLSLLYAYFVFSFRLTLIKDRSIFLE